MHHQVNTTKRAVIPNEMLIHSYEAMLFFYQNRYNASAFPFSVTWKHISYWRQCVYELGKQLMNAGLLTRENYLQQKNTIAGCTNVKQMQGRVTRATMLQDGKEE